MLMGPVKYEAYGMTINRYYLLLHNPELELTSQEQLDGWYWDDDILVNENWEGHQR